MFYTPEMHQILVVNKFYTREPPQIHLVKATIKTR